MLKRIKTNISLFLELIKFTITLPVSFLSLAGYVIHNGSITTHSWIVTIGVFLLAGAASVLNQVVEAKFDSMMYRTHHRPIPSGRVSKTKAIGLSFLFTVLGVWLLYPYPKETMLLGVFNLAWYLLVYTLLKRVTPFAVIPGSLTGAVPVLIGWVAAGGNMLDPKIILISTIVFIWQIPHFWLLMLIYGKDYEEANYPTLYRVFNEQMIRLWTLGWILTASLLSMALVYFKIIDVTAYKIILILLNILLLVYATRSLIVSTDKKKIKPLFHNINLYMLLILIFLMILA